MSTELLECGHPATPQKPGAGGTGYGCDPDTGARSCYQCCADKERASMIETGRATLYLVRRKNENQATCGMMNRHAFNYAVTDWPGKLEFTCYPKVAHSATGGGFGSPRTDAWFAGPDGYVWHAVNRGDSQLARCKRTKERVSK